MSLRVVAKIVLSGAVLAAGGLMLSQQQQQAPYYGSQTIMGPNNRQQYVIPANPPQQARRVPGQAYTVRVQPCGEFGKPPCGTVVTIPAGATGESLYAMAKRSEAGGRPWEAAIYADEAAAIGYGPAEAMLGVDFMAGKGVPRDLRKARYWLGMAADQGDVDCQTVAGEMYERAQGGAPDQAKAVHYYELAAEHHSSKAELNLGLDYEFGFGVAHDRAKAISLLRRASADGIKGAAEYANALSRARTAQFHNDVELEAFVHPTPPVRAGSVPAGCPAELNYPVGNMGFMGKAQFCSYHPGCPVQVGGLEQTCPRYTGATLDQILHDN